jgi:hypothetical protein
VRRPWALGLLALVLLALVLTGAGLGPGRDYPPVPVSRWSSVQAVALDQEWYCAVGTATPSGSAQAELVLFNGSAHPLTGQITVYSNAHSSTARRTFRLGPWTTTSVPEQSILSGPFVAATVTFDGGGGSAEQQVSGTLGSSVTPCAAEPSPRWYFATGSTRTGASLVTALFNPFPEEALANLSFSDDQGLLAPADFQGILVPGHSLVTVDVGSHVLQSSDIATAVSVRVGRLVASQLQLDAIPGQLALTVVTGAPQPAPRWYLPDNVLAPGVSDVLHLYNPGTGPSRATVRISLAQGRAAPFHVSVGPGSELVLNLGRQARIPTEDPFSIEVDTEGPGLVVERGVVAVPPSGRSGSASMFPATAPWRVWQLGAGGVSAHLDEWLILLDPGTRPARVSVQWATGGSIAAVPGLPAFTVPAHGRVAIRLAQHLHSANLSLMVTSSAPVVVERDLYRVDQPGISLGLGIPVGG